YESNQPEPRHYYPGVWLGATNSLLWLNYYYNPWDYGRFCAPWWVFDPFGPYYGYGHYHGYGHYGGYYGYGPYVRGHVRRPGGVVTPRGYQRSGRAHGQAVPRDRNSGGATTASRGSSGTRSAPASSSGSGRTAVRRD